MREKECFNNKYEDSQYFEHEDEHEPGNLSSRTRETTVFKLIIDQKEYERN